MNVSGKKYRRFSVAIAIALLFGLVGLGARAAFAQDDSTDGVDTDAVSPDRLPLPINVAGQWTGTITDNVLGAGDFGITFIQTNRKLEGGWSIMFPAQSQLLGNFKGRATAKQITFHLAGFNRKVCRLDFQSLTASGSEISGKYEWVGCKPQFKGKGTIDITPVPPV
jgi:hypothetical protein